MLYVRGKVVVNLVVAAMVAKWNDVTLMFGGSCFPEKFVDFDYKNTNLEHEI